MKLPILDGTIPLSKSLVTTCFDSIPDRYESKRIWNDQICFKHVLTSIYDPRKYAHILIDDLTSLYADTKEFTDEYITDIVKNFEPVIGQSLKPFWSSLNAVRHNYLVIDTSKIHGIIFLGLMNLFKATTEHITIPITYCYLKKEYPELKFYQRLVICQCLFPKEYIYRFRQRDGQHSTFNSNYVNCVEGLTLHSIISKWQDNGFFKEENSLLKIPLFRLPYKEQSYAIADRGSMNYNWLPSPWASKKVYGKVPPTGATLCKETVDCLLNSKEIPIPEKYSKQYLLKYTA